MTEIYRSPITKYYVSGSSRTPLLCPEPLVLGRRAQLAECVSTKCSSVHSHSSDVEGDARDEGMCDESTDPHTLLVRQMRENPKPKTQVVERIVPDFASYDVHDEGVCDESTDPHTLLVHAMSAIEFTEEPVHDPSSVRNPFNDTYARIDPDALDMDEDVHTLLVSQELESHDKPVNRCVILRVNGDDIPRVPSSCEFILKAYEKECVTINFMVARATVPIVKYIVSSKAGSYCFAHHLVSVTNKHFVICVQNLMRNECVVMIKYELSDL